MVYILGSFGNLVVPGLTATDFLRLTNLKKWAFFPRTK